ncbi:MAG: outer membrane beta-barrel protein [Alphaproteobacteria bacterium]|nr:outer membrane beta-barrel protein [Alphaproteobacteria bacterium]
MKKISASLLVLAGALIAPLAAHADPVPGWYAGLGVSGNQTLDGNTHFSGSQNVAEYDLGWGVVGSGGYAFKNGFRLEGEISHRQADIDKMTGGTGGTGTLNTTDVMGNVLYDFRTGTLLTPYVGAGLGLALADADNAGTLSNGSNMNDTQYVFIWQAIAGVAAQISRSWAITTDYRYINTTYPRFALTGGGNATTENASHNIVLGVRYSFGQEPPVPVAETTAPTVPTVASSRATTAATVAQSYMVFFDFDQSVITPEAKRILASAAQEFQRSGYVRIVVTGHTDTMGTPKYNQSLSERRASAVKTELERLGISVQSIRTAGAGEKGLLVPTADQVREAQNRRAEIVFDKKQ